MWFEKSIFKITKKLGILDRISLPHVMALLRCSSWTRLKNLLKVKWEFTHGHYQLNSRPFIINIEPTDKCNFSCPFCLTGNKIKSGRTKSMLSLDEFIMVIDQSYKTLYLGVFALWGEPLLNPHIFDMISYLKSRNIFTVISTNMSLINDKTCNRLIDSGLDYVIAAIDGVSQEAYESYRVGGNVDHVISNTKKLIEIRNARKSKIPFIEWQFVVFHHNEHEIPNAKRIAKEIGVDWINFKRPYLEKEDWIPENKKYQSKLFGEGGIKNCSRPWFSLNLRTDGGLSPCCSQFFKDEDFGHIYDSHGDLFETWNGEKYKLARETIYSFKQGKKIEPNNLICYPCMKYGRRPTTSVVEIKKAKSHKEIYYRNEKLIK